jgi:hypothetical protein
MTVARFSQSNSSDARINVLDKAALERALSAFRNRFFRRAIAACYFLDFDYRPS